MELIFSDKVRLNKQAFLDKVQEISRKLSPKENFANWLMAVMNFESGLNHKAVNPMGGAYGLIQFMPSTIAYICAKLKISETEFRNADNVRQLDFVYEYFRPFKGRLNSYVDLYLVTFFPVALGKSRDFVLQTKTLAAETIARFNPLFDTNKDKKITVGEIENYILKKIPAYWMEVFKKKDLV